MKLMVGYPERPMGWVEPDRVIESGDDNELTRDRPPFSMALVLHGNMLKFISISD